MDRDYPNIIQAGLLENALDKTDSARFFIQILWELRLISNDQFAALGSEIENIGKMLGGWNGQLIKQNSLDKTRGK